MQVDHVAVLVAENLDFDVFGAGDVLFEEYGRIAKGAAGFPLCFIEQGVEIGRLVHHPHPAPAPTEGGLDDQGEPDGFGDLERFVAVGDRVLRAWQHRHVDLFGQSAGGGFVAHHVQKLRTGTDKDDAGPLTGAGELGVFRKKAVAGVDGVDAMFRGCPYDALDVEVGCHRSFALADLIGLVRLVPMDAETVLVREDRHGAQPQFRAGPEDTHRDFTAVGGHQLVQRTERRCDGGRGNSGRRRHEGPVVLETTTLNATAFLHLTL